MPSRRSGLHTARSRITSYNVCYTKLLREFYAELPIQVKVVGTYHDMGAFAADVGALPRIVTLNDVHINAQKDGNLVMEATARTFRYLDEEEIAAQRRAQQAARKGQRR